MAIVWTADLATGVNEIDEQHKELFRRINTLLEACREGKGKEEVHKVIQFLEDYVVVHFGSEEKYMVQYSFPSYAGHKSQHLEFMEKFSQIKATLTAEGPALVTVVATNHMLVEWLRTHIRRLDKELGAYLREKIVSTV
jgi:hemerythrin